MSSVSGPENGRSADLRLDSADLRLDSADLRFGEEFSGGIIQDPPKTSLMDK